LNVASPGRDRVRGRAAARKLIVRALYQWQLARQSAHELIAQYEALPEFARADGDYFRAAIAAICEQGAGLDSELARHSDIAPARLDPVEHAILALGLWELMARPEVPYRVVINEGIELAKRFGATEAHRYVNAVLDRASRAHRGGEHGEVA
jgi:transcription antitermination protein NusB